MRSKFNCRNYPWVTINKFKNSDEVETWRKFGTPFYLRITHGGTSARSKYNLIYEPTSVSAEHIVERKKVVIMSHETTADFMRFYEKLKIDPTCPT